MIIKTVDPNSATFWNHTTQSYNATAIPTCSGAHFMRLMGVAVVGRSSRFSMRNPSLELNSVKPNLPLAVLQPGRETLYVDATVNERGDMDASNAYAIAANCAGKLEDFGVVECSGRFLAPNHPLAIVLGAPASGRNYLRPVGTADQWGVGPEACYDDNFEGRVEFKLLDGQWTRLLSDHANGWRAPITIPASGVKELRYRILCKAPTAGTLNVSCGYLTDVIGGMTYPGDASNTKPHTLVLGWQTLEGYLPTDPGDAELPLKSSTEKRNYLRLHSANVSVARVEAYPSRRDPQMVTWPPVLAQSIGGVSDQIIPTAALYPISNTTGGVLTLSSTPTMANGVDGERVTLLNVGTQSVTLQDQGSLANSNLRLTASYITLGPRDSVEFTYSATIGDWVQTGVVVNNL